MPTISLMVNQHSAAVAVVGEGIVQNAREIDAAFRRIAIGTVGQDVLMTLPKVMTFSWPSGWPMATTRSPLTGFLFASGRMANSIDFLNRTTAKS